MSLKSIATLGYWSPLADGAKKILQDRGYHYPKLTIKENFFVVLLSIIGWFLLKSFLYFSLKVLIKYICEDVFSTSVHNL